MKIFNERFSKSLFSIFSKKYFSIFSGQGRDLSLSAAVFE